MIVASISAPAVTGRGDIASRAPAGRGPSPRLRLARLARDTALRDEGVLALASGADGGFAVISGDERIDGVVCVAAAGGAYDVGLRLVCALVPLVALGERVRAKVREAATAEGLAPATVSVHISGVAAPGEV
jgi:hypothetical protein